MPYKARALYDFGWTDPRDVFNADALIPGVRFLQNENGCSAEVALNLAELIRNETLSDERRASILKHLEKENGNQVN